MIEIFMSFEKKQNDHEESIICWKNARNYSLSLYHFYTRAERADGCENAQ